jgi:CDP-diacylglycerol---glycerol-3-phosphate 3-phosphatidyltransferase
METFRILTKQSEQLPESNLIMSQDSSDKTATQRALKRLEKRWGIFSGASFLILGILYWLSYIFWKPLYAAGWGITAAIGLSYLIWFLWRNLLKNHRPGEANLLPTLGPGNTLTLARGVLLAYLAGFLLLPKPVGDLAWAPAILFTLVIAADFFDGYLARVSNHITRLGAELDLHLDGIGMLVAILLAVRYGQLPSWYLSIALARYLFLGGIYIRSRLGYQIYELPESIRRRAFAGLQMGFVSIMLWPLFTPPGTFLAAVVFATPFLFGFLLDWLIVCGVIRPTRHRIFADARWLFAKGLPLALRAILLASLVLLSGERYLHYSNRIPSLAAHDIFLAVPFGLITFTAETLILALLVLGTAGRLASIAGLLILGVDQTFGLLQPSQYLLIVIYISTIYLGTGPFSLWKLEDRLIFRKAGEANRVSVEARSTAPSGD